MLCKPLFINYLYCSTETKHLSYKNGVANSHRAFIGKNVRFQISVQINEVLLYNKIQKRIS